MRGRCVRCRILSHLSSVVLHCRREKHTELPPSIALHLVVSFSVQKHNRFRGPANGLYRVFTHMKLSKSVGNSWHNVLDEHQQRVPGQTNKEWFERKELHTATCSGDYILNFLYMLPHSGI